MAGKVAVRCVVVALTVAFVMSAFVVLISPVAKATMWTQTSDTDFNSAQVMNQVNVFGSGPGAYVQLNKTFYGWVNKNPTVAPPRRQSTASFFDSVNGRTMVIGGLNATSSSLNDTWAYYHGSNTWIKISDNAPFKARWGASAAFDSVHGIGVLFGGWTADGQSYETWEYTAATGAWTNTTGASPSKPALNSAPLAFDSTQQKVLTAGQGKSVWETWQYDVTTHIWTKRTGSNPPQSRASHNLAYYPDISRTVMYGGAYIMTLWDETWEYNYATDSWTNMTGDTGGESPGGRTNFGIVYRLASGDLMLFGGIPGYPQTTYRYWSAAGQRHWTMIPTGNNPSGRSDLSMTYNTVTMSSVVFSGKDQAGNKLNDTWAYEAGYQTQGSVLSSVFDSLHTNTVWNYITWNQTPVNVPIGSSIRFQIATCNNPDFTTPGCELRGPLGTTSGYYTTPAAEPIWAGASPARYAAYFVQLLCPSCTNSPHLEDVSIDHTATSVPPYVASTYPFTQIGVPITSQIWLNFSEPMDTGQVTVTLKDITTWTDFPFSYNWFNSSTNLVMSHSGNPFDYCTGYRYNLTEAVDQEAQSMAGLPKSYVFSTFCPEPEIIQSYPHQGEVDIPLTSPIYANFSKPMNKPTVDVNVTPPLPDFTYVWTNGDKNLKVTHVGNLADCTDYTVDVTGNDTNDKTLTPGSVPNPWQFQSRCLNPRVMQTDPPGGAIEVAVGKTVTITFSHKMDTPTVNALFTPAIALPESWNSPTDTTLTLSHPPAFTACTNYIVNVTGKDIGGNNIQGGYFVFSFFTTCGGSPYVINTQPSNGTKDVALDFNVRFFFSEAMQRPSIQYTVVKSDWTWTEEWIGLDMVLTLNHTSDFSACSRYYVNLTGGRDVDEDKDLVPGPMPDHIYFDTICVNPSVVSWVPPDNSTDVAIDTNVVIAFNKPMDTSTFSYTIFPGITLNEGWSAGDTVFTLSHGPKFTNCTDYDLRIANAESKDRYQLIGDRELAFRTFCPGPNPFIVVTDPVNDATGVALDKVVFVRFNKTMDRATLLVQVNPSVPGGMVPSWTGLDMYLNLTHAPFAQQTRYTVTIHACDLFGQCIVSGPVPNPWNFTTTSTNPKITSTDPPNNRLDVPLTKIIVINFDKAMDRANTNEIVTPSGIAFTHSWLNGDQTLSLTHTALFQACIQYTVQITGQDTLGNPLVPGLVPNPWVFTTTCLPGAPGGLQVSRQGNDIVLTWRAATLGTGYHIYSSTDRFTAWPWPQMGNVTVTTFTATGHNSDTVNHFYIVRAYNTIWLEGPNSSMGVRMYRQFSLASGVPNAQWFSLPYRSIYSKASDITTELTSAKINVVAKWDARKQTSILYYWSHNAWRGQDFNILPGDGLYIGLVSSFGWSINGTDSSTTLQFVMNPPSKTNFNFISLPYTTSYTNAQSITNELTSSKVVELGHWDAASHAWQKWTYSLGTWTGTNFAIMPGDGFYMVIASGFTWAPKLITPDVP